jgi:ribonuclease HII
MKLKKPKLYPDLSSEVSLGFSFSNPDQSKAQFIVIGVDEVGRGCLAGPVVAAAVAVTVDSLRGLGFELGAGCTHPVLQKVRDSKLIPEPDRPILRDAIQKQFQANAIGQASVTEIAELNILYASHLAMERAVKQVEAQLGREADLLIIDGNIIPKALRRPSVGSRVRATALVKGDQKSFTVACASIIAKTFRDELMEQLESNYPGYGLAKHKGYPTPFHKQQILKLGVTPEHRLGFKGVQSLEA